MKTPRKILLAQHRAAEPKLDAIRQSTVAAVCDRHFAPGHDHERRSQTVATRFLQTLWRELILPSRRIWTGLAAVWILIFVVNVSQHNSSQPVIAKSSPSMEMVMAFREQQKWLNELFTDHSFPMDADQPKGFSPKPRTEIFKLLTA